MKRTLFRVTLCFVLLAVVVSLAGCDSLPQFGSIPGILTKPVSTADIVDLLTQAGENESLVKTAHGRTEVAQLQPTETEPMTITQTVTLDIAQPDLRAVISYSGIADPTQTPADTEIIIKGDTVYGRTVGDPIGWTYLPPGSREMIGLEGAIPSISAVADVVDPTNAKITGRRDVQGVECDIVAFTLAPDIAQRFSDSIAAMEEQTTGQPATTTYEFKGDGEIAIGVADKIMRQVTFTMHGLKQGETQDSYYQNLNMTLWDVNSPDITITAPDDAKPIDAGLNANPPEGEPAPSDPSATPTPVKTAAPDPTAPPAPAVTPTPAP